MCLDGQTTVASGSATTSTAFSVASGHNVACTFTNTLQQAHLTLVKTVTNDNGGGALATAWTLSASGPTPISGTSGSGSVTNAAVNSGTYTLSESGPTGYTASAWSCDGGTQNGSSITLTGGQSATCTITNDDNEPQLHLRKTITKDNGGTAVVTDWNLTATGTLQSPTNLSGPTPVDSTIGFKADTYTLGETGPSGYTAGTWDCGQATMPDATHVIVPLGANITCTINNDDIAAHLIVVKHVINNNGGLKDAADFSTTISGVSTANPIASGAESPGVDNILTSVGSYSIDEGVHDGYTKTLSAGCAGTIALGETKTCTITNDDNPAKITLIKEVINRGGDAGPDDFGISIDGKGVISGVTNEVNSNTSHTIDEQGLTGYGFVSITGAGCPTELGGSVTLNEGEEITCTITNREILKSISIEKSNDKSSGASAGDTVNYTLVVTNTGDADIPNVVVTDILPGGFSYINNSAQINGVPQNPGISGSVLSWNMGTVTTENPVTTITYQAKIGSDVSDGTYTNFASCRETVLPNIDALVLFQPAVCETVHSDVPIGHSVSYGGNLGQVLGISTELPATGNPTGLLALALGTLTIGLYMRGFGGKKSKRNAKN